MIEIVDTTQDGYRITIWYDGEDKPCYLKSEIISYGIVRIDDVFPNPVKASAHLASEVGYGPACGILNRAGIPKTSQLWHLNHSGPPAE